MTGKEPLQVQQTDKSANEKKTGMIENTKNIGVVDITMNEKPLNSSVEKKRHKANRDSNHVHKVTRKITCFNIIGCRGLFILALILAVAGIHGWTAFRTTRTFTYLNRKGVWVFFLFAIIYGFLFLYFLVRWKS